MNLGKIRVYYSRKGESLKPQIHKWMDRWLCTYKFDVYFNTPLTLFGTALVLSNLPEHHHSRGCRLTACSCWAVPSVRQQARVLGVASACPAPFSSDRWQWPEVSDTDHFLSCLLCDLERKACPCIKACLFVVFVIISNGIVPSWIFFWGGLLDLYYSSFVPSFFNK